MISEKLHPRLYPGSPVWTEDIKGCPYCKNKSYFDCSSGVSIHMSSCVLTQTDEGWFRVCCANCHACQNISYATPHSAVIAWNAEFDIADTKNMVDECGKVKK